MKACSKKKDFEDLVGWEIQYNPANKQFTVISSGVDTSVADYTLDLEWHFVVVVYNKDITMITVDGKDITTDQQISAVVNNPDRDLLVGSSSAITVPAGGAWVGYIDEFRIFKYNYFYQF
jgi:hypothetical protein